MLESFPGTSGMTEGDVSEVCIVVPTGRTTVNLEDLAELTEQSAQFLVI